MSTQRHTSNAGQGRAGEAPLRILFVSNLFPDEKQSYRGLDNATVLHALEQYHPCEVRVLSPRPSLPWRGERAWRPRAVDAAWVPQYCRALYVPRAGSWWNHHLMRLALARPLRALRDSFAWDVLLASWLYPDGWAAAQWAKHYASPSVLIAQGSDVHGYLRVPARKRRILEAAQASAGIITRSRSLATLLQEAGVAPAKLHPVWNGTDTTIFHPGDRTQARAALGLPAEAVILLFVGNFLPVKDPLQLLRSFHRLCEMLPNKDLRLAMAGKGPLQPEAEHLATQLGVRSQVVFTGPLAAPAVARWMQAADVLCMSSRNEGLPNVIIEAQACGLPVVSTDVGGISELISSPQKGA
ncbi:MAG: glycosyltransferase, partial [Roseimicrobium sp.]